MLDLKFVRSNPQLVKRDLEKRGDTQKIAWLEELLELDKKHRALLVQAEELRAERNKVSLEISELKKEGKSAEKLLKQAQEIPAMIEEKEVRAEQLKQKIFYYLMRLPNILEPGVPVGKDEGGNKVVRTVGKKPLFGFTPKDHVELIQLLDLADVERAAKVSGARFYYLKNDLVLLENALMSFALEFLAKKSFTPVYPPLMLRKEPYEGVTALEDFETQLYKIEGEDLYLIATSEHAIAAMHSNEILELHELPMKYAGISQCFRKEAGAHGRDTKGIFRVHQFNKVEQFVFCEQKDSKKFFEEILANAEELVKKLELPYRVVNICTGEIGSVAAKKFDIEAWLPAQNAYREIVSCSNCTAYQSTRLNIRYRLKKGSEEKAFVHTLNSTALASPRTLVAILENFQQKDGSVKIPRELAKRTGIKEITARK